jgi:uncharacterized protein YkwD
MKLPARSAAALAGSLLALTVVTGPATGSATGSAPTPGTDTTSAKPAVTRTASAAGLDTSNRRAVRTAYRKRLLPGYDVGPGWTGSVRGCRVGTTSQRAQQATLRAVNFMRDLGGLAPVRMSAARSRQALQAALMMQANGALSHAPPRDWRCWTRAGAEAAGRSNLFLWGGGDAVPVATWIAGYMTDPGEGNTAAGHRRWIMYPGLQTIGSGSTTLANALHVIGDFADRPAPQWVGWPAKGWFPHELEPDGRWSLSGTDPETDFHGADVRVLDGSGARVPVRMEAVQDGYGSNTLVWQVGRTLRPGSYTVRVSGIRVAGRTATHSYVVRLFRAG